ncbi:MAG: hydrogenase iron-sulfur subunit [Ignavibacteriales bacterium]|nr:hydrogenase iron-sulfur subunit [Ignavibacteriales bacterium]
MEKEKFEPKITAFVCNWCTYTGADLAGTSRLKQQTNARLIRCPCIPEELIRYSSSKHLKKVQTEFLFRVVIPGIVIITPEISTRGEDGFSSNSFLILLESILHVYSSPGFLHLKERNGSMY